MYELLGLNLYLKKIRCHNKAPINLWRLRHDQRNIISEKLHLTYDQNQSYESMRALHIKLLPCRCLGFTHHALHTNQKRLICCGSVINIHQPQQLQTSAMFAPVCRLNPILYSNRLQATLVIWLFHDYSHRVWCILPEWHKTGTLFGSNSKQY